MNRYLCIDFFQGGIERPGMLELARQGYRFSPWVGYDAQQLPSSLFLEIQRTAPLWGGEERLAWSVAEWVREQGHPVAIAVAQTPSAAWALARFTDPESSEPPRVIPGSHTRQVLEPLPVEALRVDSATIELLRRLGIRRIGQLLPLPRPALASRFGPQLLQRLDQITGQRPELIPASPCPKQMVVQMDLEHPTDQRLWLQPLLEQLLDQFTLQLRARAEGVVILACQGTCEGGARVGWEIGLYRPTADPQLLGQLVQTRLESLVLPAPLQRIRLQAQIQVPLKPRQQRLPGFEPPLESTQLETLINRLSNRLGSQRVLRPSWQGGIVPERACRWVTWTGHATGPTVRCPPANPPPAPRPLWLCQPPRPLPVMASVPDGPPACVWEGGRKQQVVRHWGPERIESGWWRGPSQQRDYYRIELQDGRHWWLFRQRSDGRWFVHGYFG